MGNEAVATNTRLTDYFSNLTKMVKDGKMNEFNNFIESNYDGEDPDDESNGDSSSIPGYIFKDENGKNRVEPFVVTEDHPDYEMDIANRIINDKTVQELKLNIRPEDIMINGDGKIVVRIYHNNVPEIYRFDIIGDKVYVQAPLNKEYINFVDRMIYKFVTVPIDTITGRNIVSNANFVVDLDGINSDTAPGVIFRINDTAV